MVEVEVIDSNVASIARTDGGLKNKMSSSWEVHVDPDVSPFVALIAAEGLGSLLVD